MLKHSLNALLRALIRFARWIGKIVTIPAKPKPYLSDHLARDMGLTPKQIDQMRVKLPSQSHVVRSIF
ncbi:MAG: hypothetical protein GY952_04980 [Rhodobacteraceae bacterium]|nr:hypothetical protein [Paracoccaceae bacterium]